VTLADALASFARQDAAAGTRIRPSGKFTIRIGRSSADLPLHLRVAVINSIEVLRLGPALAPAKVRTISLTGAAAASAGVLGETLTPDGQRLLVSNFASGQVEAVSVPTIP
jgi:hypothetical protein